MRKLHYILRRRSLDYLRVSEDALSRDLYDVSGVLAQISAELVVKATISFLGYSFPETHEIRRLLGVLSSITLKDEIQNFINAWFKRRG
ncbi:MAG: HEPN domain-containing protein [Vulcanisaeta sp.]